VEASRGLGTSSAIPAQRTYTAPVSSDPSQIQEIRTAVNPICFVFPFRFHDFTIIRILLSKEKFCLFYIKGAFSRKKWARAGKIGPYGEAFFLNRELPTCFKLFRSSLLKWCKIDVFFNTIMCLFIAQNLNRFNISVRTPFQKIFKP
jgi:hypothetical protein